MSFETKFQLKAYGCTGKIYTKMLGHMTLMAALPLYGKAR